MKDIILAKLSEIEQKEKVRIIYCAESGSRAWGFASPDSDYDVRFIYVRPIDFYLRLDKTRDVIEWQLDDVYDINGWDLQKALRLLHSANPTLFEWRASPIVYKTTDTWDRVEEVFDTYFAKKAALYHYLSMAHNDIRIYLQGDTIKLKKYFYILRPLLACRWILSEGTPPPMLFSELAEKYLDDEVRPEVDALVELKKSTPELGEGACIDKLNTYIERIFAETESAVNQLPADEKPHIDALNRLFADILSGN